MKPKTFDLFNIKIYSGPNPYLNTAALVFDFALFEDARPLKIDDYVEEIGKKLPQLSNKTYTSYADLFAGTLSELTKLEMELHFDRYSVTSKKGVDCIAVQSLDHGTTEDILDFAWDWLEAITEDLDFDFQGKLQRLQELFRRSVYGGPTVYSILKTAYSRGVPSFYLPDEGLLQYGYGKYQVRGVATTFTLDSQLDSDFTTRKDDCKTFLANCGFPVPKGKIVRTLAEAKEAIKSVPYPVAVKPVVGHKGIGVTANIQDDGGLEFAYEKAVEAIASGPVEVIVEQSITGTDFRLLCVDGKFVAAVERRPPFVTGDGSSTIKELIERENATEARKDTPTSALGKIITDDVMEQFLSEQNLSVDSVLKEGEVVYLRKVANLSAGGVSVDATKILHPDNKILAQEIAQYFNLVCLGVDVISQDLSRSWKKGNFGIIEINAAPGIFMHLKPAIGESVDVPGRILDVMFPGYQPSRIPIVTFNNISWKNLRVIVAQILMDYPDLTVGAVCRDGVLLNGQEREKHEEYATDVQSLLRHPKIDLLLAEYPESIFAKDGMFYEGSDIVVLDRPSETEKILARDLIVGGTLIVKDGDYVTIEANGLLENYQVNESESLTYYCLKEIKRLMAELI